MLVGRESERGTISTLLAGARMGTSGVLVLRGEAGIGKTSLLAEAASLSDGLRLLQVQGIEAEQMVPFAGLLQLLRPILHLIDRIPPLQRPALSSALMLGAPATEPTRFAIGAATLSMITLAAEDVPIGIFVDDAQLLDPPSSDALIFAARRLGSDAVALLATVRDGEPGSDAWQVLPTMPISGVDLDAAARLLAGPGLPVRTDQLVRLHRATGGNPLALLELASQLDRVDLVPEGFPLAVSEALAKAFIGRAAGLSADARTALLIAAADNTAPGVVHAACRTLGLSGSLLGAAEDAGLISVGADRIGFRHPLVRSAVYADAGPEQRRAAHRALAAALPRTDVHRIAWHLAESVVDPDEPTAATLESVAALAARQGAYATATNAYERAAVLSIDARGTRRLVAAADAAWAAAQPDRTNQLLDRALAADPDAVLRAHVHELRGGVAVRSGSLDVALSTLQQAAATIEDDDPDGAVRLLADAIHVSFYLIAPTAARLAAAEIERLLPRTDDPATRSLGMVATGMSLVISGFGRRGAELINAASPQLIALDDLANERFRIPLRLQSALWLRESTQTRQMISRTIDALREEGALSNLPYLLMQTARVAATTDSWDEAETEYQEALRLAGEIGLSTDLAMAASGLACVLARRGKVDDFERTIAIAGPIAEQNHVRLATCWFDFAGGDLACGQGRIVEALGCYRRLVGRLATDGFADPDQWPTAELVECQLQLGRHEEAIRSAREFMSMADGKGQPWSLARAERALALCGDSPGDRFEAALSWHALTADHYETARTQLGYGSWLRRSRRRADARPLLAAALDVFDQLGATPWADRAANELLATGAMPHRRSADPITELTGQERQIAQLLASGRTTREAAAALFLSPKTVEYHLRHVYWKLGIRSRQELAERFGQLGEVVPGRSPVNDRADGVRAE
ncbi:MAG: AAA family ATPase [Microlunatus sp.]|nr:AAA family ATPase [Microlunatus sp.]